MLNKELVSERFIDYIKNVIESQFALDDLEKVIKEKAQDASLCIDVVLNNVVDDKRDAALELLMLLVDTTRQACLLNFIGRMVNEESDADEQTGTNE